MRANSLTRSPHARVVAVRRAMEQRRAWWHCGRRAVIPRQALPISIGVPPSTRRTEARISGHLRPTRFERTQKGKTCSEIVRRQHDASKRNFSHHSRAGPSLPRVLRASPARASPKRRPTSILECFRAVALGSLIVRAPRAEKQRAPPRNMGPRARPANPRIAVETMNRPLSPQRDQSSSVQTTPTFYRAHSSIRRPTPLHASLTALINPRLESRGIVPSSPQSLATWRSQALPDCSIHEQAIAQRRLLIQNEIVSDAVSHRSTRAPSPLIDSAPRSISPQPRPLHAARTPRSTPVASAAAAPRQPRPLVRLHVARIVALRRASQVSNALDESKTSLKNNRKAGRREVRWL